MPNIQSQTANSTGLHVVASDGREYTIASSAILADFAGRLGDRVTRRLLARSAIRTGAVSALGAEQIDPAYMDVDFDESTGQPTELTFRTPGGA